MYEVTTWRETDLGSQSTGSNEIGVFDSLDCAKQYFNILMRIRMVMP